MFNRGLPQALQSNGTSILEFSVDLGMLEVLCVTGHCGREHGLQTGKLSVWPLGSAKCVK